jgi:transcriptional regulator with XRE-family HTH domain
MTFKDRIKELRVRQGLTQDELGGILDYGRTAISNYESGRSEPSYEALEKLSTYFHVSVDYLLGRTDNDSEFVPKGSFIKENIDLIRGNMTYEDFSKDIAAKLNNLQLEGLLSPRYIEKIAKGKAALTPEGIGLLSIYAQVNEDFFYKKNNLQELILEQEQYKEQKMQKTLLYDKETDDFIRNPDNLKYIKYAKKLKEKGIDPDCIINYTIKAD